MEHEPESASTLAWLWVIEALASFKEVNMSLLHDVIEMAPELPDSAGKNAREMVALRCLEGLFGPINGSRKDGPPVQYSKIVFDSSESCEDVLQRILYETSESALRLGGPEMLKWDVSPFITEKRACTRCTLQELKDTILDGTHPYVDFLLEKSGLASINKRDNVPMKNNDCIELNRRLDGRSPDPQSKRETSKQSPILLEDERRLSVEDPSSFSSLPSKRSRIDSSSEDEARHLPGCDDVCINVKKLKQKPTHTSYSGEEAASPHGTGWLEDSCDRVVLQNERDDTNHLGKFQMGTLEDDKLVAECSGSKRSGQCIDELQQGQSGIPCCTTTAPTDEGETHQVIGIENGIDGSEVPFGSKASNNFPDEGTLHKTFGHEYHHVKATNIVSHSGFLPNTVATNIDVNTNLHEEEKYTSSDSDGYHDEKIDIAKKKNEFFSSQCMVSHDSFVSVDGMKLSLCVKCNEGGQLLSCNSSDCPLVVHVKCLGSSVMMNDMGDFYCPFCEYSLAISEYLEAKKKAVLTKKNLATFIRIGLEHQPNVIKGELLRKDPGHSQKAGVQDVVEICEDVDLGNKDNQVNLDGEHVNEVIDLKICEDVNLRNNDNQVNLDGHHVSEVIDHQSVKVIDTVQVMKLSESSDITNSKQRENEENPLRVAPDALAREEDGDGLVDQECQANMVAELEESLNATKNKHDIHNTSLKSMNILHADEGPVEAATEEEVLQHQTGDSEEKPVYALDIEGAESSDDDNDESIISNYSIRFRRRTYHHTCPATPQLRRKKLPWTAEEEGTLKEGVRKFSSSVERSPTIPWKKILEFGSTVFLKGRTPIDLKDKWRNLCKSPKFK